MRIIPSFAVKLIKMNYASIFASKLTITAVIFRRLITGPRGINENEFAETSKRIIIIQLVRQICAYREQKFACSKIGK